MKANGPVLEKDSGNRTQECRKTKKEMHRRGGPIMNFLRFQDRR